MGLSALGTNDEEILEELKSYLYLDNAIAGEAAGIAMGLVACGSASEKTSELLAYAHETQHEKVQNFPPKRIPCLPFADLVENGWDDLSSRNAVIIQCFSAVSLFLEFRH